MHFDAQTLVADIAAGAPATIKIFQRHQIEFCCGGRIPLADACAEHGLDVDAVMAELSDALSASRDQIDWRQRSLSELVEHIQATYHVPLAEELPRLAAMVERVVQRHGSGMPETLLPLRHTFHALHAELIEHMAKEDRVLFPAVRALEAGTLADSTWIEQPIEVMESEHDSAGAALARIRELTSGYAPPDWACPTFRGLYHGLAQLESDMHQHVHLENHVLFPRAAQLARAGRCTIERPAAVR